MLIVRFWKPILWLVIIMIMSLIPGNKLPGLPVFPHFDKVVHAAMYFGLAVLLVKPFRLIKVSRNYLWSFLICISIGSIIELSQEYLAFNRTGSWIDEMSNIAGALLGIIFYHFAARGYRWEKLL